ncbi:MAG: Flp pilus assembly protein CpaB [Betaproteobacteria bacterium]
MAENTTKIVVAARDVDPGTVLGDGSVQVIAWPSGSVPTGAIKDLKKTQGRVASTQIFTGEPILEAKLARDGATGGLSSVLAEGKRAISIQANEIVGVAGYIRPGSRVDIMVNTHDNKEQTLSKIVLENILVLATAQDDKRDQTKPKVVSTVTLEVDPRQAEMIDLARSIGTLSMALRNSLDTAAVKTVGVSRKDLMGDLEASAAPAPVAAASGAAQTSAAASAPKPKAKTAPKKASGAETPTVSAAPAGEQVEIIRGVQKANSNF